MGRKCVCLAGPGRVWSGWEERLKVGKVGKRMRHPHSTRQTLGSGDAQVKGSQVKF